jgi:predicted dinucleotide-binding enzyme
MSRRPERIAIIGGTGALGYGLALRLSRAFPVTIGSRTQEKAAEAAARATSVAKVHIEANANAQAASVCEIAMLPGESAAERVAKAIPGARVAGAFHTVPASRLAHLGDELAFDVLVTAGAKEVFDEASRVVSSVGKLRPLYAGPLSASRLVEGITPALLNVSKLNGLRSPSIKLV